MRAGQASRAGFCLGALAVACLIYALMAPPLDSNLEQHRKMQTSANLELVGRSLDEWTARHGRVPDDREALGVLELRESPAKDGWGHPLIYKAIPGHGNRKFQLRSAGPNGQDDGGEGDDISFPVQ